MIDRWYRVNYAMAGSYQWGKDLGCEFVTKSCMHWMTQRQQRSNNVSVFSALLYMMYCIVATDRLQLE